jgi:hypothetical protein
MRFDAVSSAEDARSLLRLKAAVLKLHDASAAELADQRWALYRDYADSAARTGFNLGLDPAQPGPTAFSIIFEKSDLWIAQDLNAARVGSTTISWGTVLAHQDPEAKLEDLVSESKTLHAFMPKVEPDLPNGSGYINKLPPLLKRLDAYIALAEKLERGEVHSKGDAIVARAMRVDPAQRAAIDALIQGRWGVRPHRWLAYVAGPKNTGLAQSLVVASQPKHGINPAFLYTVAIGEGFGSYLDLGAFGEFDQRDLGREVNGYAYLGTDTFSQRVAGLKKRGFLRADFDFGRDFQPFDVENELGQTVQSATFTNADLGLEALGAMLADMRARFVADVRALNGDAAARSLTDDQLAYFTYLYFNAGPGFGKKELQRHGLGYLSKWTEPPLETNKNPRYNALIRLATYEELKALHVFDGP